MINPPVSGRLSQYDLHVVYPEPTSDLGAHPLPPVEATIVLLVLRS